MLIKVYCALIFTLCLFLTVTLYSRHGRSWHLLAADESPHAPAVFSIAFRDSDHGWALTPSQLLQTADGGQTWKSQIYSEKQTLYSLALVGKTKGWVVGSRHDISGYKPLIMYTADDGTTWQRQFVDVVSQSNARAAPRLLGVSFCNAENGWAVGSGLILHTTNSGETWETQYAEGAGEKLIGVQCLSNDVAWVVGEDGVILKTEDGGMSWDRDESPAKETLLRIHFARGIGWAVGLNGTLLRKTAGNEKWERQALNLSEALFDITFVGKQGWIVGTNGTILHTNDDGNTWQKQNSPTDGDLTSLFFLNPNQGWIGGNNRMILRLSDNDPQNDVGLFK